MPPDERPRGASSSSGDPARRRTLVAQAADPLRQPSGATAQVVDRPREVQRGYFKPPAGVADHMDGFGRLSLRIDEQPARQIEGSGIRQELIEIGVGT